MKIATYNVNGITTRLPQLLKWLKKESPDVVCLQELKTEEESFPKAVLRKAGYGAIVHGQSAWNGVAILNKGADPAEMRRGLPGDPSDRHSRYLEAAIDGILIACLYLPNGNPQPGPKFDYKLAWFERLIRHAKGLYAANVPAVLAGDFNVVPTDFDIYSPKSWKKDALLQPASRAAYARLLAQGWTDAIRERHPDEAMFTYWDYFRNHWARNAGLRIDHLLLSRKLNDRLVDANVDRWVRGEPHASDHAPVWVEIGETRRGRKTSDKLSRLQKAPARKKASRGDRKLVIPAGAVKRAAPATLKPMLATLVDSPPAKPEEWLFEIKFDGYRILARIQGKHARLMTRNGHDWTSKLEHIQQALERLDLKPGWLDGEIVLLTDKGTTSFQALQNAFDSDRTSEIVYYLFDVPYYAGYDLTRTPLEGRQALLQSLTQIASDPIRLSTTFDADPRDLLASADKLGLEGIIGKAKNSFYSSRRSPDWIKLKCGLRQEFVIGGWTDPKGSRVALGSLLLGVHDDQGDLQYAGKVGTGFDNRMLPDIARRLKQLGTGTSPFKGKTAEDRHAHWVRPRLLAEVSFAQWTADGHLRHPVFHALRADKAARAIVRERGANMIKVSHPDRIIDSSVGITKQQVVDYYALVGNLMMEHLRARPVSLVRAPQGVRGVTFFQKHADQTEMEGVRPLKQSLDPDHPPYLEVISPAGLQSAAQMNVLEFHTWNALKTDIDKPDRMTFDLDPGQGVAWPKIQEAAELMHGFLKEIGLPAFVKTSGGKGLHVVTPIRREYGWDSVKGFSRAIVEHMAGTLPQIFVAKSGPRNRVGKIFIDYLRNGFGATTACAWSARSRPGLGISVPFRWSELSKVKGGAHWTIENAAARVRVGNTPWRDYAKRTKSLTPAMKRFGYDPKGQAPRR